jgi:hypothetical protein
MIPIVCQVGLYPFNTYSMPFKEPKYALNLTNIVTDSGYRLYDEDLGPSYKSNWKGSRPK